MRSTALLSTLTVALHVVFKPAVHGRFTSRECVQTDPAGVVYADYLQFESTAVSLVSCAGICSQTPACASFTFSTSTRSGNCRGHSKVMTPLSAATPDPGARLFYFLDTLDWLESACSSDLSCPALDDVYCHNSKCTCTPGYFLSASRSQCMKECPAENLGHTFVDYFHLGLRGYNDRSASMTRLDDCTQACLDETSFACLSVEWQNSPSSSDGSHACLLSASTVQKPGTLISNDVGWTYYQRTCQ